MVAAADRLSAAARAAQDPRATVAADIAKRTERPVPIAHDEDRLCAGLGSQIAAGLGELGDVARELPASLQDQLLLGLEDRRVAVETGSEGE